MALKQNRFIRSRYAVIILMFVVVVAAATVVVMRRDPTDAAPSVKPGIGAAVPSKFSFGGVVGWWQGATRKTDMALFHRADSCFVSVQYYTGTVDIAAKLQKLSISQAGDGGTSTPGAVIPMMLQTNTVPQQYQLHQYTLDAPADEQLLRGLELGYIQLPGSYIKVEGHCDTPGQLAATIPALQAIKFDASK